MEQETLPRATFFYKIMSISPHRKYLFVNIFFVLSILIFAYFALKTWSFEIDTLEKLNNDIHLQANSKNLNLENLLADQKETQQQLIYGLTAAAALYLIGFFIGFYFIKTLVVSLGIYLTLASYWERDNYLHASLSSIWMK